MKSKIKKFKKITARMHAPPNAKKQINVVEKYLIKFYTLQVINQSLNSENSLSSLLIYII